MPSTSFAAFTKKAVVLLSGGLDSTTCMALAYKRWGRDQILAVSFSYGQKHQHEVAHAAQVAAHFGAPHQIVKLPDVFRGGPSTLMQGGPDNPVGTYAELPEGPSPTYVPFRNGNLLSVATAVALGCEASEVWFGAHTEDAESWAYPDCTPEFIGAMANAIWVGSYSKVRLVTPLEWMTKAEVVAAGFKLRAPYHLTLSCYNGEEPACGRCPTCLARIAAFEANGLEDPIPYALQVR